MKKTDLERNKGLKIASRQKQAGVPDRFGRAAAAPDRREQRRLDQARGLVPFAVKLESGLVARLRALAEEQARPLDDVVGDLLAAALPPQQDDDSASLPGTPAQPA